MNQREIDALKKCIEQVKAGMPVEDCIIQSSDLSPEAIDILKTTKVLMSLGENQATNEQMKRSLVTVLSHAARLRTEGNPATPEPISLSQGVRIREFLRGGASFRPIISRMALVLGITAILILISGGLVITSAKSLPGDSLCPVKLAVEDITVYLVPIS
jgi:hypothetical protein